MIVHSFAWVQVQVPHADSYPYCSTAGNFDTLWIQKRRRAVHVRAISLASHQRLGSGRVHASACAVELVLLVMTIGVKPHSAKLLTLSWSMACTRAPEAIDVHVTFIYQ